MPENGMGSLVRRLCDAAFAQEASDAQLLTRFVSNRDEAALEAIVRRHATMVWSLCQRVLGNRHDAEDAFQATFLVFLRKVDTIRPRAMVGNWLYGVAFQTARKARATTALRRTREKQTEFPQPGVTEPERWSDEQPIIDEELNRLPDKYRVVLVLCDLEGKSRKEAAQQLDWPEGSVAGRLARARATLAKRLTRRGIVLSGSLAALLPSATSAAPRALAAAATIPENVALLSEGVLQAMRWNQLYRLAALVTMVCVVLAGGALLAYSLVQTPQAGVESEPPRRVAKSDDKKPAAPALEKLHGIWKTEKSTINGKPNSPEAGVVLEFKGDQVFIHEPAVVSGPIAMSVALDDRNINFAQKPVAGQIYTRTALNRSYGLYVIDGDRLTLALQSGYSIPKDLSDTDQVKWVLKREKSLPAEKAPEGTKFSREKLRGCFLKTDIVSVAEIIWAEKIPTAPLVAVGMIRREDEAKLVAYRGIVKNLEEFHFADGTDLPAPLPPKDELMVYLVRPANTHDSGLFKKGRKNVFSLVWREGQIDGWTAAYITTDPQLGILPAGENVLDVLRQLAKDRK